MAESRTFLLEPSAIGECCGDCRYFDQDSDSCHRRSPVYIVQKDFYGTKANVAVWPPVRSSCWCGEWEGMFGEHANQVSIKDVRLSTRARKALRRKGVRTVGDASLLTENQLLSMSKVGQATLKEIKQMLARQGLSLSDIPFNKEHLNE